MKTNYDVKMMEMIEKLEGRPKLLLHSCCGPCSTACIERLKPFFDVTVIYYNPNIEPLEEYEHRKQEQIRYLKKVSIPYLESYYDNELFSDKTKALKEEPEGGKRCSVCFGIRLQYTANEAKKKGFAYFATTLTVSPHKNSDIINTIGHEIGQSVGIPFLYSDFKKKDGYKRSITLASEFDLYRQNYCGCLYSKRDENEE